MKYILWLILLAPLSAWGLVPACGTGVTVGTLTLKVYTPRTSCASPCLLFFDTTGSPQFLNSAGGSSDTAVLPGANNPIQDIYYAWSFGDPNASGTGTWAYGSRPNQNSMNTASGPIAAHLYVLPTGSTTDLNPIVEVWAYDGTNIATCTITVTVFAPSGASGFPGTSTTCVAAASLPVAGSGGCPSGAAVLQQSNMGTALTANGGAGKRVLFHCGDTFSGTYGTGAVSGGSIGAYGGCENTTTSRPIFNNTSGTTLNFQGNDWRVADIDFEDGTSTSRAIDAEFVSQISMWNIKVNLASNSIYTEATQLGIVNSFVNMNSTPQSVFMNVDGSACLVTESLFCGFASYNQNNYNNISYNAIIGTHTNGNGTAGENTRVGVCRMCVFSNNDFEGSTSNAATLKIHEGQADVPWNGQYTEILEISDNLFTGPAGGQYLETRPQNTVRDERGRFIIVERNLFTITNGQALGYDQGWMQVTMRNNVVYSTSTDTPTVTNAYNIGPWPGTTDVPVNVEVYNNTCYMLEAMTGACVSFNSGVSGNFAANNIAYTVGATNVPTVAGTTGNTVSNNTTNTTVTFAPTNTSGSFSNLMDFKPTAVFTGASTSVPVYFDASGLSWIGAYTLGAVSQAAPTH